MMATKRTPVPLPSSKARSKDKEVRSKAPLSQEYIESDNDSLTERISHVDTTQKPQMKIAIHKPNGVINPKLTSRAKSPSAGKPAPKSKAIPHKHAQQHTVTQEQIADLSSSEQTDDSDALARGMQAKSPEKGIQQGALSESESDSTSASSSDESSADKASVGQKPQDCSQAPQTQSHAFEFQPEHVYIPPRGFNAVPLNDRILSEGTTIFDNLAGRQIWHITTPVGVSLKDMQEFATGTALEGEAILSHKGMGYSFSKTEGGADRAREVFMLRKSGYKAISARISRTLHLQAVLRLPGLSDKQADQNTGSEAAASITRSTIRAPRPQVTGLKMRFFPTGFAGNEAGTLGESDGEAGVPRKTAVLGMPNGLNLPSRKEKRKLANTDGVSQRESLSKKVKKHRTPEERRAKKKKERKEKNRAHDAAPASA